MWACFSNLLSKQHTCIQFNKSDVNLFTFPNGNFPTFIGRYFVPTSNCFVVSTLAEFHSHYFGLAQSQWAFLTQSHKFHCWALSVHDWMSSLHWNAWIFTSDTRKTSYRDIQANKTAQILHNIKFRNEYIIFRGFFCYYSDWLSLPCIECSLLNSLYPCTARPADLCNGYLVILSVARTCFPVTFFPPPTNTNKLYVFLSRFPCDGRSKFFCMSRMKNVQTEIRSSHSHPSLGTKIWISRLRAHFVQTFSLLLWLSTQFLQLVAFAAVVYFVIFFYSFVLLLKL